MRCDNFSFLNNYILVFKYLKYKSSITFFKTYFRIRHTRENPQLTSINRIKVIDDHSQKNIN